MRLQNMDEAAVLGRRLTIVSMVWRLLAIATLLSANAVVTGFGGSGGEPGLDPWDNVPLDEDAIEYLQNIGIQSRYAAIPEQEEDERPQYPTHRRGLREGKIDSTTLEKSKQLLADYFGGTPGFYHSVASGDPLPNAVIIWTRYTPVRNDEIVSLEFRIAPWNNSLNDTSILLDPNRNPDLKRGVVQVRPESDWTAKIDIVGLQSNTKYVFVFTDGKRHSDVGLTRTAPALNENVSQYDPDPTYSQFPGKNKERINATLPDWEIVNRQDYRLRYASSIHADEGLRNLRQTVPMIAIWDDHELTNNAWTGGAVNHQPTCPVTLTSPPRLVVAARCSRNEGYFSPRWDDAIKTYFEWMPIRLQDGKTGTFTYGTATQIIEWGNLATFTVIDTRISYRTQGPTERGSNHIFLYSAFAAAFRNASLYSDKTSAAYLAREALDDRILKFVSDPNQVMIGGEYIDLLRKINQQSKALGKTWQIWGAQTAMGLVTVPDLERLADQFNSTNDRQVAKTFIANLLATSVTARGNKAMAMSRIPFTTDSFDGFAYERKFILDTFKEANNMVVLGGDIHEAYVFTLNEGGTLDGTPVAVQYVGQGVTSPGFVGRGYLPYLRGLLQQLGTNNVKDALEATIVSQIPTVRYANYFERGFYAVVADAKEHVVEYYTISDETIGMNFTQARQMSGGLVAPFVCDASFRTIAGIRGSVERLSNCGRITFLDSRPSVLNIPVPDMSISGSEPLRSDEIRGAYFGVAPGYDRPTPAPTISLSPTPSAPICPIESRCSQSYDPTRYFMKKIRRITNVCIEECVTPLVANLYKLRGFSCGQC